MCYILHHVLTVLHYVTLYNLHKVKIKSTFTLLLLLLYLKAPSSPRYCSTFLLDDFHQYCHHQSMIQFADDVTQNEADRGAWQLLLEHVGLFMAKVLVASDLNSSSTHTKLNLLFETKQRKLSSDLQFVLNGICIKPSPQGKLLWITFDFYPNFEKHIDKIIKKCHRKLYLSYMYRVLWLVWCEIRSSSDKS